MDDIAVTLERRFAVEFRCEKCGGTVSAEKIMPVDAEVAVVHGATCDGCPTTYTVEMTRGEVEEASDA